MYEQSRTSYPSLSGTERSETDLFQADEVKRIYQPGSLLHTLRTGHAMMPMCKNVALVPRGPMIPQGDGRTMTWSAVMESKMRTEAFLKLSYALLTEVRRICVYAPEVHNIG